MGVEFRLENVYFFLNFISWHPLGGTKSTALKGYECGRYVKCVKDVLSKGYIHCVLFPIFMYMINLCLFSLNKSGAKEALVIRMKLFTHLKAYLMQRNLIFYVLINLIYYHNTSHVI